MLGRITAAAGLFLLTGATCVFAQSLKGSRTAMRKQNAVAQSQDYTFLVTSSDVRRYVDKGLLVPVRGNANYKTAGVSFPYARPAVKLFVERLASQYKAACGEKLVVTSLTRPLSRQPRNASDLSVHPAGMAVDLRLSRKTGCRRWLEESLAGLEKRGVLEATKERNPAHYHIAVFPTQYTRYAARTDAQPKLAAKDAPAGMRIAKASGTPSYASVLPPLVITVSKSRTSTASEGSAYTVKRGDSLWSISRRFHVSVNELKSANQLRGSALKPGQTLTIPGAPSTAP
jgi:LysM repeat protein